MVRRRSAVFAAAVLGTLTGAARLDAADPLKDEQEFVARVNRSIEKGKRYLIQQEGGKGNWEGILEALGDQHGGQTALATLALLTAGVKPDEPVMQRALTYLRRLEPQKTYVVGLTTMALAEARDPKDLLRIQKNVDWLVQTAMRRNGQLIGWSYPMNPSPDGSNTQYALLGLYAGKQAGAKIPDALWKEIRTFYARTQHQDPPTTGFWVYLPDQQVGGPANSASLTMTVAGVCGLLIADMGLNESQQQLNVETGVAAKCGVYDTNGPTARGMNWVAGKFSFDAAPGLKAVFYNIYGIERLGRLSGQRFIGKYDWYREGCEYLVRAQHDSGRWRREDRLADRIDVLATSFALLFLSKGKTPVLVTKLAHGDFAGAGGLLVERGDEDGKVGWNRKHSDARHLTEFASRELFNGMPLGWQVYDPRRANFTPKQVLTEVGSLLASPVVYMNGHRRPVLTGQQKDILKRYVDEGGFLLAEACCGSKEFAAGFEELMKELFPDNQLTDMPPEHPIWKAYFAVSPADFKGLKVLERGCKTVAVFSPIPLAGYWEENRFMVKKGQDATNRGERAFRLAGNVIAYATGMEPPQQKGTVVRVVDLANKDLAPPRGAFKPAQLRLREENHPAPAAMRNLMAHLQATTRLEAVLDKEALTPDKPELLKYKFMYLHGRKRMTLTDAEIDNLKMNLETGGLLFADAACGAKPFDEGFRELVKKMYPDQKLEVIPFDDELYSEKLNGVAVRTVRRREKLEGEGPDAGFKELPPHLEGVKIDGRWAIVYSKYDVGCSLEGHKSTDCLGHTKESALQLASAVVLYSLKR